MLPLILLTTQLVLRTSRKSLLRLHKVTGSENADNLKRVSGKRMNRELVKKMKALKNDIELALIRGTIASGAASNTAASLVVSVVLSLGSLPTPLTTLVSL
jgi:hypothetical protein